MRPFLVILAALVCALALVRPVQAATFTELNVSTKQEDLANSSSRIEEIYKENTTPHNRPPFIDKEGAMQEDKGTKLPDVSRIVDASNSGINGTTSSMVQSGMRGGPTTGGPTSIEFAIAPFEGNQPAYHQAIFIKSGQQGNYEVALPPGKYWIGPKARALDPMNYVPGPMSFSEKVVVVTEGAFTHIDLSEVGYAP
jgi:hypothetical protein